MYKKTEILPFTKIVIFNFFDKPQIFEILEYSAISVLPQGLLDKQTRSSNAYTLIYVPLNCTQGILQCM